MLDLSDVEFSSWDKRNFIKIPKMLTSDLAEETGLHIGDGCLITTRNMYMYSLRGHHSNDIKFYRNSVSQLYYKLYNLKSKIRFWDDVVGFQTFSKAIGTFKINTLGLPLGKKTGVSIPEIFHEKKLIPHLIRGIFDTDGCIDFEKKSREVPYYPRITICTTSKKLLEQISYILSDVLKFNISTWKIDSKRHEWRMSYRVCTRGEKNFNMWFKTIGSHNPKYVYKYNYWKRYGYAPVAQTAFFKKVRQFLCKVEGWRSR